MSRVDSVRVLMGISIALVMAICLGACGDDGGGSAVDTGPRDGYPLGPFGLEKDDILENHNFLEIVNEEESTFSLDSIYQDGQNQLLILTTSAEWCTACIEEQKVLNGWHKTYHERGLEVLVTLFEDASFNPATAEDAADWKRVRELDFPVVADTEMHMGKYYDTRLTPMVMLVEVPTMKILRIDTGLDQGAVKAIIDAKLP